MPSPALLFVSVCVALAPASLPSARAEGWSPWRAVGPFAYSWEQGAENPLPFDDLARFAHDGPGPDAALPLEGLDGEPRSWIALAGGLAGETTFDVGRIDVASALPHAVRDNSRLFLHRSLATEEETTFPVYLGSDDGLRVWWNGELVCSQPLQRGLKIGDAKLDLVARPGTNHLLVELSQRGGAYAFRMSGPVVATPERIEDAIERGVRWLIEEQWLDGTWGAHPGYRSAHPAFTAYVLRKMGVPEGHACIRRALEYARRNRGPFTYGATSELLLLSELEKGSEKEWMRERVKELVDWQESSGHYGYPLHPDGNRRQSPDLSNTLFVALAFHAVSKHDVKVPVKTWQEIVKATLRNTGRTQEVTFEGGESAEASGFFYWPGKQVTGSITTAGMSILELAQRALGKKLPRKQRKEIEATRERGLAWLAHHLDFSQNPGEGAAHHYFFLYGIERVASLLGLREVGGEDWYQGGADYLVTVQHPAGHWGGTPQVETLAALLFLKRATLPRSGRAGGWRPKLHASSENGGGVLLRAQGEERLSMYVAAFTDAALERHAWSGERDRGLRVRSVEYRLQAAGDPEPTVIGEVPGDPTVPSGATRYEHAYSFERNGVYRLSCRVRVVARDGEEHSLSSAPVEVRVDSVYDPRSTTYAEHPAANRLADPAPRIEVSSTGSGEPEQAVDRRYSTHWMAKGDDRAPWIRLVLKRATRGGRLLLTHGRPRLRHAGDRRASRVVLVFDGEEERSILMETDVMTKTEIDLGRTRFTSLEIRIAETVGAQGGAVGFSEIELVADR